MVSQTTLDNMNTIPIFNVLNVRGYCVYIDGILRTFIFAEDIAREAGLTKITTRYDRPLAPRSGRQDSNVPISGSNEYYQQEDIRWQRFNEYVNLSLPSIESRCPEILHLLQLPIHRYSYVPAEVALVVLMHCKSQKAIDFQVVLACKIVPEIQRYAVLTYERQITNMQNEIYELQEMIDCNNVNKMMTLEEENEFLKNFIKERKYRLDGYDLHCLKGVI